MPHIMSHPAASVRQQPSIVWVLDTGGVWRAGLWRWGRREGEKSRAFPLASTTSTSGFLFLALTPAIILSGMDVLQDLAQVFALLTLL